MSLQLDLIQTEDQLAIVAVANLKQQMDSVRRKIFAEQCELKKEIEFLSIQLQMLIEEKDKIN